MPCSVGKVINRAIASVFLMRKSHQWFSYSTCSHSVKQYELSLGCAISSKNRDTVRQICLNRRAGFFRALVLIAIVPSRSTAYET
jgi:hypothetical protein